MRIILATSFLAGTSHAFSPASSMPRALTGVKPLISPLSAPHSNSYLKGPSNDYYAPKTVMPATAVSPPEEESTPLFEKVGVGIKRDLKSRYKLYGSDIKDGLNTQCLAATAFLFFACLAPAIGFGSLFGTATGGAIGTIEMVSSTAASGILYALLSAQPLTIIGSTGPVLAFVACLYQLSQMFSLPFLPLYSWTGLWTAAILFLSSITSGSNLVKYLTRFTDEIFSLLISVIFVYEAALGVGKSFVDPSSTFTKGLLTLLCATSTYTTATLLRKLRSTSYFTKGIRKNVANFAPTIGVVGASLVARWARLVHGQAAVLPALSLPATFGTTSGRAWLVPLMDLPVWARWGALIPALMATVLLFLDQNITVRLVNNNSYKMTKGRRPGNMIDGMHLDMLIVSILTAVQSLLGLPWLVAATVRSISHVRALSVLDKAGNIKRTLEQRMTGLSIHALIGACVIYTKPRQLLTQVPKSVLMGLFMFLGISALPGNEMWERVKGLIQDGSEEKVEKWSNIPKKVVNKFTLIQVACLSAMFCVKESAIGVLFPVIIAMMAPLRFWLESSGMFKKEDVDILDDED